MQRAKAISTKRTLTVEDVYTRDPVCVTASTPARELGRMLDANEISGAPVIDGANRVVGVVSKSDLLHLCVEELLDRSDCVFRCTDDDAPSWDPYGLGTVSDFMTGEPITARLDDPLADVAAVMADARVHRVVVVDDRNTVIGILTTLDILQAAGAFRDAPRGRRTAAGPALRVRAAPAVR